MPEAAAPKKAPITPATKRMASKAQYEHGTKTDYRHAEVSNT
ncbi:hypothetical protein OG809_15825 [Kribbella soli]